MFVNRDYLDDNSQRVKNLMGGIMSSTAHDERSPTLLTTVCMLSWNILECYERYDSVQSNVVFVVAEYKHLKWSARSR